MDSRWAERCRAQRVRLLEGERHPGLAEFGYVMAREERCVYPLGGFEVCGGYTVFPAQTANAQEEDAMLAASSGLASLWDGVGFLTFRFVKQREGSDYALFEAAEQRTPEADTLLALRGLGEWAERFSQGGENTPPVLEDLPVAGIVYNGHLFTGKTLRAALRTLPDAASLPELWRNWRDEG